MTNLILFSLTLRKPSLVFSVLVHSEVVGCGTEDRIWLVWALYTVGNRGRIHPSSVGCRGRIHSSLV